jgi:hypothetical protein
VTDSDRPRSPFAVMADLLAGRPVRTLSAEEMQMLASHRLYLETEYHTGHRANFASVDLSGRDFSGLNLRGNQDGPCGASGVDFTREPSCKAPI